MQASFNGSREKISKKKVWSEDFAKQSVKKKRSNRREKLRYADEF